MRDDKRERLEKAGWKIGSADEFLGLSPEESAYLNLKERMGTVLREWRTSRDLTQTQLATKIGSSQSRVAKMESGDPTVTLDLVIKALIALGASNRDLADAIASPEAAASS
jgi:ribosome-binding protein aMBF1 (putative translation factor)